MRECECGDDGGDGSDDKECKREGMKNRETEVMSHKQMQIE